MCVLHHCEVMMNRWPTKRRRAGGDLASTFLSLYFIMEITSFTWRPSPFISYCHQQNPFSMCTSVCVFVCVCSVRRKTGERQELTVCNFHLQRCFFWTSTAQTSVEVWFCPTENHFCLFLLTFGQHSFLRTSPYFTAEYTFETTPTTV